MTLIIKEGLCFDDVLLIPQHSTVTSRSEIDLKVNWGRLQYAHPVIPANMKTIIGREMAFAIMQSGGLAILHRFLSIEEQQSIAREAIQTFGSQHFAISLGVKPEDIKNAKKFLELGVRIFCIDIAHGDSQQCVDMITDLRKLETIPFIIAGNVATGAGARRLWEAGANVVKVGVGPGSLCTTRIETGNGVPQLTALIDVAETQRQLIELYKTKDKVDDPYTMINRSFPFISDGGIKSAGDVVKALCFADMVMVGNVFAGCAETPGQIMSIDGRQYKEYVGSSTHKVNHIEGVAALVPVKGTYNELLTKMLEGVRSGCSYQGAANLTELKENPEFIRITGAGLKESHPHDVVLR